MKQNRSAQLINERCKKLEDLGFKCSHEDSTVIHPDFSNIEFDFSATNFVLEDIIYTVINKTYEKGFADGKENLRQMFNKLLTDD